MVLSAILVALLATMGQWWFFGACHEMSCLSIDHRYAGLVCSWGTR